MKNKTIKNRYAGMAREAEEWVSGRARLRTSMLNDDGTRTVWEESGPEVKARRDRLAHFKAMRADLGLTRGAARCARRAQAAAGGDVSRLLQNR